MEASMSEPGRVVPESEAVDPREIDAKRFNTVVVLIALGTLGAFLYVIYKAVDSMRKAADEAEGFFGLLAPPQRKSRRPERRRSRRTRIVGRRSR
jgi:hypothetical protein